MAVSAAGNESQSWHFIVIVYKSSTRSYDSFDLRAYGVTRFKQKASRLYIITDGSCQKYHFCRDKTRLLSRQKYACRDEHFVATNTSFVATKVLILLAASDNNTEYLCKVLSDPLQK